MQSARKILILLCLSALILSTRFAFAFTTVADIVDLQSSLKTSTDSNHQITFVTASALNPNDKIEITFPSGFDLSSVVEDDLDISDDAVDLTTDSGSCGAGHEVDFYKSGQEITLTLCTVGIATGSEVVIEVGTNAAASGSGANQITNPSSAATYFAMLKHDGGDYGFFPIPIISDDDGNVSATVPSEDGGGNGGGGGGGGTAPSTPSEDTDDTTEEDTTEEDTTEEDTTEEDTTEEDTTEEDTTEDGTSEDTSDGGDASDGGTTDGGSSSGTTDSTADEVTDDDGGGAEEAEREVTTRLTVGNGQIAIDPSDVLSGTDVQLEVGVNTPELVESVTVTVGDTTYGFVEVTEGVYQGLVPVEAEDQVVTIVVDYEDGQAVTHIQTWSLEQYGWVFEVIDDTQTAVSDAVVIVYEGSQEDRVQWDAAAYGQSNPTRSGSGGTIAFYVPNGVYTITAAKTGYEDSAVTVRVSNNILAPSLELTREIEVIEEDVPEEASTIVQTVESVTEAVTETVAGVALAINNVRELPQVQAVADVTTPVAVATAVGSATVLSSSFNLLSFLRYLFSSPILFFARRKRKRIGTIYNAISKLPIDLATIRIYNEQGKLIKTAVSDKEGNYIIRVKPGRYRVEVKKAGFTFPSQYLEGAKQDEVFADIYTQGIIEVTKEDVVIAANIPMDPSQDEKFHAPQRLLVRRFLRILQNVLAIAGLVMAIVVFVIQTSILTFGLLLIHSGVYLATKVLTKWRKKRGWGIVKDAGLQKVLPNTVVRLFEPKFNKLIESTVTDGSGRYAFMAGPNEYYMTFEKPGYEKQEVRPIDLKGKKEPELISVDTLLKKKS